MMQVHDLGRTAIDRSLKTARLPFDAVAHLLPSDRGPRNAAGLVIDRADATVRAAIGRLLNDAELRADAARRRVAADERERANDLRAEALRKEQAADANLSQELDAAERLRDEAEREAQQRMQEADDERARREQRTRDAAAAQKREVERVRREQRAAEEKQAKRERLEVLEDHARTLDQETDALTAQDEAQRLRDAANTTKAARKRSS
jgi:hypothetical protein